MDRKGGGTPPMHASEVPAREVSSDRLSRTAPLFPWETTSFFQDVFAPKRPFEVNEPLRYPEIPHAAMENRAAVSVTEPPAKKRATKQSRALPSWHEQSASDLQVGTAMWVGALVGDLSVSAVGQ